jgi:hypothetical protein
VTSGTYDQAFNLMDSAFCNSLFLSNNGGTAASAAVAFLASLADGTAYFNTHTIIYPAGEIRGFFSPLPAPGTLALLGLGLGGLAFRVGRYRHKAR